VRGSRLIVLRGKPEEVLPKAFSDWSITQLCYEVDVEPYALRRDAAIGGLAAAAGVEVTPFVSHTLYVSMLARVGRAGGRMCVLLVD
jgi:cryptochrome